jgi:hypothetical protein
MAAALPPSEQDLVRSPVLRRRRAARHPSSPADVGIFPDSSSVSPAFFRNRPQFTRIPPPRGAVRAMPAQSGAWGQGAS